MTSEIGRSSSNPIDPNNNLGNTPEIGTVIGKNIWKVPISQLDAVSRADQLREANLSGSQPVLPPLAKERLSHDPYLPLLPRIDQAARSSLRKFQHQPEFIIIGRNFSEAPSPKQIPENPQSKPSYQNNQVPGNSKELLVKGQGFLRTGYQKTSHLPPLLNAPKPELENQNTASSSLIIHEATRHGLLHLIPNQPRIDFENGGLLSSLPKSALFNSSNPESSSKITLHGPSTEQSLNESPRSNKSKKRSS